VETPTWLAARWGTVNILAALLEKGGSLLETDSEGQTPVRDGNDETFPAYGNVQSAISRITTTVNVATLTRAGLQQRVQLSSGEAGSVKHWGEQGATACERRSNGQQHSGDAHTAAEDARERRGHCDGAIGTHTPLLLARTQH
jgi:hypothetical protein